MVMIRDLGGDPSEDQKVEPLTKTQCHICIGPPRVPSFPFAIISQSYCKLQSRYPEKTLSITSVEEGWSSKDDWEQRAELNVLRFLKYTLEAEEFHMLSCKSLICLYSKHFSYICNPASGELKRITPINHQRDGIGFGFDATENQYKLVLLHLTDDLTSCDILTLGTNSRSRAINDDPAVPTYNAKASCPTTIRESIYWITTPIMDVLSFNVESRKFKLIPAAMDPIDSQEIRVQKNIFYSLGEALGDLCMVYHNGISKRLWVWTLIEDAVRSDEEHQWCWRYNINLTDLPAHTVPWHRVTLISVRGGRIILWSTLMGLVSYFDEPRLVDRLAKNVVHKVLDYEFEKVLYKTLGWWNQAAVYEKSSTPSDDITIEEELAVTSKFSCCKVNADAITMSIKNHMSDWLRIQGSSSINRRVNIAALAPKHWKSPAADDIKVNFDAAFCKFTKIAGIGLICRNVAGRSNGARGVSAKALDPEQAEALGAFETIKWAKDKGITRLHLEGDNQRVVNALNGNIGAVNAGIIIDSIFLLNKFSVK